MNIVKTIKATKAIQAALPEAYQTVITDFENHFLIEDESDIKENTEYNDNGNLVNTDNLALCGILDCNEWQGIA